MSTDNSWQNANGEYVKKVKWHIIWIWDHTIIERYQHYLTTGSHVLVEGASITVTTRASKENSIMSQKSGQPT